MAVRHMRTGDWWLGSHADTGRAVLSRPSVAEPRRGKRTCARIGQRCALVAGADSSIRQLLRTVLEIGNFDVVEAASQADVLKRLAVAEQPPRVIVLDVLLPTFSGLQTLSHLRRDPRLTYVPVVVLTSFAEAPDHARFLQHGATAVMTKPFSSQRLLDLVNQVAAVN
jgi:CheY-like chemotaxis protein